MRESTLDYSDPIPCQLHAGCKSTVCIQATSLEAPRLQVKRCPDTPLVISTHYQVFGRVKSRSTIKFQRQRFGYAFGYVETKNAPKGTFFIIALAERVGFAYILQAAVWLVSQTLRILHAKSAGTSLLSAKKMPLTGHLFWRRGWDSNPRYLAVRLISSQVHSTTLPPLQVENGVVVSGSGGL